jgi:hypothetical protein
MFTFATDYFLLVFVSALGVIQIGASFGGLSGLLFLQAPKAARALGTVLAVAPFIWFFATGERNINDYQGGLDAPTQALFFFLGTLAAGGVTFVVSSVVNWRMDGGAPAPEDGMDALRNASWARALAASLQYWRKNWRRRTKQYFSG